MRKKLFSRLVLSICAMLALTSCGGDKASGTGELATVFVRATGPASPLDSDVITWVDATGAAATRCDPLSLMNFSPDSVNYTLTSTAYTAPNTGSTTSITPSSVSIDTVTVTLTRADTLTPELPARFQTQYPTAGGTIAPGGTLPVPVEIVGRELKDFLVNSFGAQSINCSNQVEYHYRAVVSFQVREISTDRVSTVTASGYLNVNIADFQDS